MEIKIQTTAESLNTKTNKTEKAKTQTSIKKALTVIRNHAQNLELPKDLHEKVVVKEDLKKLLPYLRIISRNRLLPIDCTLCTRGFEQKANSTLLSCLLPSHMDKIQQAMENQEVIGLHEISPAALVLLLDFLQGNSLATPKQASEAEPFAELILFAIHHGCESLLEECDTILTKWLASHQNISTKKISGFFSRLTSQDEQLAVPDSRKTLEAMSALVHLQPALKSQLHKLPKTNVHLQEACLDLKPIIPNGELEILDPLEVQKTFQHSREAYQRYAGGLSAQKLQKREERFDPFLDSSRIENLDRDELIPFLIYASTREPVDDPIVTAVLETCQKDLLLQLQTAQASDESRLLADAHFLLKLTSQRPDWKEALCSQHIFMTTQESQCSVSLLCLLTQSKVARAAWRNHSNSLLTKGTFPLDSCSFDSCSSSPSHCDPQLLPHLKRALHGEQIEGWEGYNETLFIELLAILDFLQCDQTMQTLDQDLATKVSPYNLVEMLRITQKHPQLKALLNSCIAQINKAHCGVQIQHNAAGQLIIEVRNKTFIPEHILDALDLLQYGSIHSLKISHLQRESDEAKPTSPSFSSKLHTTCAKAAHLANRFFTSELMWWIFVNHIGAYLGYLGAVAATGSPELVNETIDTYLEPTFLLNSLYTQLHPTHIANSPHFIPAITAISLATLFTAFRHQIPNILFNQPARYTANTLSTVKKHIHSYVDSKRWATFAWIHHRLPETFTRTESVSKIIKAGDDKVALLDLRGCSTELTDADIADLVDHYPNIQQLKLSAAPQVSAKGWTPLKDLRLEKLYLDLNPDFNESLRPLASLNLQSLCNQGLSIEQIHVSVRNTYPIQNSWTVLQNCPKEVPLHLQLNDSIKKTDFALLVQSCPSLQELKTPLGKPLSLKKLQTLVKSCPQLTKLSCEDIETSDITELVKTSINLKKIFIANSSDFVPRDGIQLVESCPNLEEIVFVGSPLNDAYLQELAQLKHLRVCQIDSTSRGLTDVGIEALQHGKSGHQLFLGLLRAPGISPQKYEQLKAEGKKHRNAFPVKNFIPKHPEELPDLFMDLVKLLSLNTLNVNMYFPSVSDAFMQSLMSGLGVQRSENTKLTIGRVLELLHLQTINFNEHLNRENKTKNHFTMDKMNQLSNLFQNYILGLEDLIKHIKPQALSDYEKLLDQIHLDPSLSIDENDLDHVRQSWVLSIQNFLNSHDGKRTTKYYTQLLQQITNINVLRELETPSSTLPQLLSQFDWNPLKGLLLKLGAAIAEREDLTDEERSALFVAALLHPHTWDEILNFCLKMLDG